MPRQRTVRAAKIRTIASGCSAGDGKRPALERSAVCQFTERSPSRYFAADAAIGATSRKSRIINVFLTVGDHGAHGFIQPSSAALYKLHWDICHLTSTRDAGYHRLRYP